MKAWLRIMSVCVSVSLVFGLCPALAFAKPVEGLDQDEEPELATQEEPLPDSDDAVATSDGIADDEKDVEIALVDTPAEEPIDVVLSTAANSSSTTDISNAISMSLGVPYTGSAVHPDLQLAYDGKALVEGADYEITGYKDSAGATVSAPTEMGTYAATVRGLGSYTGTADKYFQVISSGSFAEADIDYSHAVVYTGSEVYPEFKVTLDGKTLVQGADFVVASVTQYDPATGTTEVAPIERGYYTAILRGVESKGYSGQQAVEFSIVNANDISGASVPEVEDRFKVTNKPLKYEWTGNPITPTFTVVGADGKTLKAGQDYTAEYLMQGAAVSQVVDEGRYTVRLTGQGDYTGTSYIGQLHVVKPEHDITAATVEGFDIRYYYTGETVVAESPKVTVGLKTLVEGTDYRIQVFRLASAQVSWDLKDIIYPAHYYVRVMGLNDYIGTKITEFYVIDKAASEAMTPETVTDSSTGVAIEGTLFEEMNVDGNEVRVGVGDVAKDNPTRNAELLNTYKNVASAYFKVFDVSLDLFDVEGDLVTSLTEKLGSLSLALPVDSSLNGRTATIIHLHKNADGTTEEIRLESKVVNGVVTVVVDKLSEFVITVNDKTETTSKTNGETTQTEQTDSAATKASTSKGTLPPTGDSLPLPGLLVAAALAAGVSFVALRRETSR